ncbi:MAG TPA: hypothetical protein VEW08_02455 [Steroidobacteraceae bacterium]|nr:hypothetical protein [Steroidobacteraceae bacterium]
MRSLLQLLAICLCPERTKAPAQGLDPHAYLRPLIVLVIVVLCGPEVFAAADLVALLDLLGAGLFLTAFAAGFQALGVLALTRMQQILFPAEWTVFLKAHRHPSIMAHGLMLIGVNVLSISVCCLVASIWVYEVVWEAVLI